MKASITNCDAIIIATDKLSDSLTKYIASSQKPFLPFVPKEKFAEAYTAFYKSMLE
jgi:starch synthase